MLKIVKNNYAKKVLYVLGYISSVGKYEIFAYVTSVLVQNTVTVLDKSPRVAEAEIFINLSYTKNKLAKL